MSPPLSSGFHTPVHSLHFTLGAAAAFRELDLNGGREGEGLFFFFKGESLQTAYFIQPSPLTPSPGMNHALFLVPGGGGGGWCISLPFCPSLSQGAGASSSACENRVTPGRRCWASGGSGLKRMKKTLGEQTSSSCSYSRAQNQTHVRGGRDESPIENRETQRSKITRRGKPSFKA